MNTSADAEDVTQQSDIDITLLGLYKQTINEERRMKRQSHSLFHIRLWGVISPAGNIYRLNALIAERLKHSDDLWIQLREIAEQKKDIFPQELGIEERADRLFEALQKATVHNCPASDAEESKAELGYKPMEEFLGTKVEHWGPFLIHSNSDEASTYKKNLFVSLVILAIQIMAPTLIFLNQWNSETNFLRDGYFWQKFEPRELVCLADTFRELLTMMMGVLFLILVSIVIRSYVDSEIENLEKQSKLCLSRWWTGAGVFANAYCCLMTMIILPLLFWSELRPTDIVLDALGLLFIFTLDDLAGDALGYLEIDDTDFQRFAVWHTSMLTQCPVKVENLVNLQAQTVDDIWNIRYSSTGQLLASDGKRCATRLEYGSAADESTPLIAEEASLIYHKDRTETGRREFGQVFYMEIWYVVRAILAMLQILVPPAWIILSQPCYAGRPETPTALLGH